MQKGFGLIGILIVVGVIAILGVGALKKGFPDQNLFVPTNKEKSAIKQAEEMKDALEGKSNETVSSADTAQGSPSTSSEQLDTSSWKTYRNEEYGFEFKYPPSAKFSDSNGVEIKMLKEHLIYFPEHSTDWSLANIYFAVYQKSGYKLPESRSCKLYNRHTQVFGYKEGIVVEQESCDDGGSMHGTGHTLEALISLQYVDVVFWANLNNEFINENGQEVLSTLKFIR